MPTSVAQYLYDGDGTRVAMQTISGGALTVTSYIGNIEEVAVTTEGMTPGTKTTTYYYAGPMRVATAVDGTLSYLADDVLGTDTVAFDASGTPIASRLYDPYGHVRYSLGAMPGTYGFTGQREDAATGLDYFVYRYYDLTGGQCPQGRIFSISFVYYVLKFAYYVRTRSCPSKRACFATWRRVTASVTPPLIGHYGLGNSHSEMQYL